MPPLKGITVVTLEHAIAAPFCTRQLADLGARVIKVERPGVGDFARGYDERVNGLASHFVWTNRSKESLTLDVKHAQAPRDPRALLARADVLVQNLAPGAAARLGLSFDTLHAKWPRLIVCDISGYGDDPERPGPYRDKKAYDLLIQSEAGFLSVTGTPEQPAKAGCSIADIAAGMYAYSGILAALIERGRSGKGVRLDVSMLESMVEWMSFPLYYAYDGAPPPPRAGAAHATIFPYGPFPAGDGKTVMLGLQNEREWQAFCAKVLQRPELAGDPRFDSNARRVQARDALAAIIDEVFSSLSGEQVVQRLDAGADRQRARQRHARGVGASAAGGARPLDRGGLAGRARFPRSCRRRCPRRSRPAWMPCRRSARTAMRCSPSSGSTMPRSRAGTATAWCDGRRSTDGTRFPRRRTRTFRRHLALRRDPGRGDRAHAGPAARLDRLGTGRQGRASGRSDRALHAGARARRRPERGADPPPRLEPAGGCGHQRGRVARGRAGRRAQRLGVPSGGGGVSAGAGGGAGDAAFGPRAAHRRGGRLRGRHPRRRVSRPLALQGVPHHRHRRHAGGRRRGGPVAAADARADDACVRLGGHAVGGAVGVPARGGRFQAAAHRARRRGRPQRPPTSRPMASPARAASSRARAAWLPACRAMPIRRD